MTHRKRVKFLAFCLGTTALVSASALAAPQAQDQSTAEAKAEKTQPLSTFSMVRGNLRKAVEMAKGENRAPAATALLDFYMARGLFPEALMDISTHLPENGPALQDEGVRERVAAIRIMATFGREGAPGAFASKDTALFWKLAASALKGEPIPGEENAATASHALGLLFRQPEAVQKELALPLTDALLAGGDAEAVRRFADALAAEGPALLSYNCEQWLSARLAEFEGFPEAAKARYATMGPVTDRCTAHGKLRLALLQLASNRADPEVLKGDMKELAASWYGDSIEEGALRVLALLERDESDPTRALSWMRLLADRYPHAMDEEHVAKAAAQLAAALFSRAPQEKVIGHRKLRRAYLGFLKDSDIRRHEDERFAALLLEEGNHKEAAGLFARLLKNLPEAGAGAEDANAAERRRLTVLKAEAELKGGAADDALTTLAALPDFANPAGWPEKDAAIYLEALIAENKLDEANIKLAHLLSIPQTENLAEAYIAANDWEQAYHLLKGPLEREAAPQADPAYYDLFASAALLSAHEAEAATLLRGDNKEWNGNAALAGIAALNPASRSAGEPAEKVEALLKETEELVGLAKAL